VVFELGVVVAIHVVLLSRRLRWRDVSSERRLAERCEAAGNSLRRVGADGFAVVVDGQV
jgi:hypothetical protein